MDRKAFDQLASQGRRVDDILATKGWAMFVATLDWQSPLRGGGQPGCKGEHSDPTYSTAANPDPMRTLHDTYRDLIRARDQADRAIEAFHHRHDPLSEAQADLARNRVNSDPGCIACGGPAPAGHRRAGKCDACRKAWERAGKPDLTTFRRQRQHEAEAAAVRLHEHELSQDGTHRHTA